MAVAGGYCLASMPSTTITKMSQTLLNKEYKMKVPYKLKQGQSRIFHQLPSGLNMEVIFQKGMRNETLNQPSEKSLNPPPLVFLHGSFHAAWCWAEHWLPFFSQNGFDSYALSLLGQGESDDPDGSVAGSLQILQELCLFALCHQPGIGFVDVLYSLPQHIRQLTSYVLVVSGLVWRYLFTKPVAAFKVTMSLAAKAFQTSLPLCKETFFSREMDDHLVLRYQELMTESSRMPLFDLRKLNASLPVTSVPNLSTRVLVMGAANDFIVDAKGLEETGSFYGVEPARIEGVAHDMMLDSSWEKGAQIIQSYLQNLVVKI